MNLPNTYYRFIYFNSRGAGEVIRLLLNIPPSVCNPYVATVSSHRTAKGQKPSQLPLPYWEDVRYPLNLSKKGFAIDSQYQKHRKEGAFACNLNKLPVLQVVQYSDNKNQENTTKKITNVETIGQSHAIARFISIQHGFMGKNPTEQAYIDNLYENIRDIKSQWFRNVKQTKTNSHEKKEQFLREQLPKLCLQLEQSLPPSSLSDETKKPWLVGATPSLADVSLYHMLGASKSLATGSTVSFFDGELELIEKAYVDCTRLKTSVNAIAALPTIQLWEERRPDTVS